MRLSEAVGLSRASIVNIEAGRQCPTLHALWNIAVALEIEVHVLIPLRTELDSEGQPIHLSEVEIAMIESAANGNPRTRTALTKWVDQERMKANQQHG